MLAGFWWGNLKEGDNFADIHVGRGIILNGS
jgi:hypothetical protein